MLEAEAPSRIELTTTEAPFGLEHNVTSVIERSAAAMATTGGLSNTWKLAVEEQPVDKTVVFVTTTVYIPAGRLIAISPTPPVTPLVFVPRAALLADDP